jgi:putative tryptophan/tyrosine transport system substrate-binding protein
LSTSQLSADCTIANAPAGNESEIDEAFTKFDRRRPDALVVVGDPLFNARRDHIVALAARHAVPAMYDRREPSTRSRNRHSHGRPIVSERPTGSAITRRILSTDQRRLPVMRRQRAWVQS